MGQPPSKFLFGESQRPGTCYRRRTSRRHRADIGCGSGFITEGLIRAGLHVIAVDQSEAMLAAIKRKFANIADIDYRCGEAGRLPISNDSVDYAFANMYLHHVR